MKSWARANPAASLLLLLVLFILVLIAINSVLSRASCIWYGYQTERDTRYAAFVGCMVQTPSGWVPRAEIRTTE